MGSVDHLGDVGRWQTSVHRALREEERRKLRCVAGTRPGQYQAEFDRQAAAGRTLVYLNAYSDGGPRFTAILYSNANPAYVRHALTPPDFHAELDAQRGKGLLTRALTGYEEGTNVYYAAFWTR